MEQSIFIDGDQSPDNNALEQVLEKTFPLWNELNAFVFKQYPAASEEWNFSKAGWNYRIRDDKRVIIYLMPCKGFFRASFVLGRKAVTEALSGEISEESKAIIAASKTYAEGTGIRIMVNNKKMLKDAETLVTLKLKH